MFNVCWSWGGLLGEPPSGCAKSRLHLPHLLCTFLMNESGARCAQLLFATPHKKHNTFRNDWAEHSSRFPLPYMAFLSSVCLNVGSDWHFPSTVCFTETIFFFLYQRVAPSCHVCAAADGSELDFFPPPPPTLPQSWKPLRHFHG